MTNYEYYQEKHDKCILRAISEADDSVRSCFYTLAKLYLLQGRKLTLEQAEQEI